MIQGPHFDGGGHVAAEAVPRHASSASSCARTSFNVFNTRQLNNPQLTRVDNSNYGTITCARKRQREIAVQSAVRVLAAVFDRHGVLRGAALLAFVLALLLPTRLAAVPPLDGPRVFLLNPEALVAAKAAVARRDPAVLPAWDALRADADKALAVNRVLRRRQRRHAAERRQARLHEPGAVLLARSGEAGRQAVHPQGRRAEPGDRQNHGPSRHRRSGREHADARPRVLFQR